MISDKDILRAYRDAALEEIKIKSIELQIMALKAEAKTCRENLLQYKDQIAFMHQDICNPKPIEPLPDSPNLVRIKIA